MKKQLCPSAPLYKGSQLLGIINTEGNVSILAEPLEITQSFIESATNVGLPENRFRFVNKCVENGCKQWENGLCSVIASSLETKRTIKHTSELPKCAIRPTCRWFNQEGKNACDICPQIKYINL